MSDGAALMVGIGICPVAGIGVGTPLAMVGWGPAGQPIVAFGGTAPPYETVCEGIPPLQVPPMPGAG